MKKVNNLQVYKKCLIVVDMVNGFVREGILHDKEIETIIKRGKEIIAEYINANELVVFIKDTHTKESTEFIRFGNTNHCLKGSSESQLVNEYKEYENMDNVVSIEKNSTSFMEAPNFRKLIKKLKNIETIDVFGCCTDICVANGTIGLSNYLNEWNKDVEIKVHEDAIETYGAEFHNREEYTKAAKLLMQQQGIQLVKKR